MILFFSGTGNSAYAAHYVNRVLKNEIADLFEKIKNADYSEVKSDDPWVIVAPTYCWQLPRILEDWIMRTDFRGNRDIYFILTCGSSTGNAGKYLRKLCEHKGLNYRGYAEVVMPENYIAMFNAPGNDEAEQIIGKAEQRLSDIAEVIQGQGTFADTSTGIAGIICSGPVNRIYYPLLVRDRKFYAENSCDGCGFCVRKCPLGNISLSNGRPIWNGKCTHCMACIAHCPHEAIEYGRASWGRERYLCSKFRQIK